jgi:hypothetical protein
MTLRRSSPSRLLSLGLLALVWGAARPSAADAQMRRAGHWQFSVPINFVSGETIDGAGGSSAEMNNDVGWGIGFAYHINDRFMVGFETTWLGGQLRRHHSRRRRRRPVSRRGGHAGRKPRRELLPGPRPVPRP